MYKDVTQQFFSYVSQPQSINSQAWSGSQFLKSSTSCLIEVSQLRAKLTELQKKVRTSSRFERQQQANMIQKVKQKMKEVERGLALVKEKPIDIKASSKLSQKFKESVVAIIQVKLYQATFFLKDVFLEQRSRQKSPRESTYETINLSRPHFLEQSQEEVMKSAMTQEYGQIEKSIHSISAIYKESLSVARMQELLVDNISGHVTDIDDNVDKGKGNLIDLHQRETKNRGFILKVFAMLYVLTFFYLVCFS